MTLQIIHPAPATAPINGDSTIGSNTGNNTGNSSSNKRKTNNNNKNKNGGGGAAKPTRTIASRSASGKWIAGFAPPSLALPRPRASCPPTEKDLFEWIRHGLDAELRCLEDLSRCANTGLLLLGGRSEEGTSFRFEDREATAFDGIIVAEAGAAVAIESNKENSAGENHGASKKGVEVANTKGSDDKENIRTTATSSQSQNKLPCRLPFVDWKTTLARASASVGASASASASDNSKPTTNETANTKTVPRDGLVTGKVLDGTDAIGRTVSRITDLWLLVLNHLDHHQTVPVSDGSNKDDEGNPSGSCASGSEQSNPAPSEAEAERTIREAPLLPSPPSFLFSAATSYRSQIYRRLTLVLSGFVAMVDLVPRSGPSQTQPGSLANNKSPRGTLGILEATTRTRVVELTRELARKILREAGSAMKKKTTTIDREKPFGANAGLDTGANAGQSSTTGTNGSEDAPSFVSPSVARRSLEADGIYYYCWFTAIAAECGEYLGDLDTARLAYKSVRAMEDRQQRLDSRGATKSYNVVGVYPSGERTVVEGRSHQRDRENRAGVDDSVVDRDQGLFYPNLRSGLSDPGGSSKESENAASSPRTTVTRTPANTPNAALRKKQRKEIATTTPKELVATIAEDNHTTTSRVGNGHGASLLSPVLPSTDLASSLAKWPLPRSFLGAGDGSSFPGSAVLRRAGGGTGSKIGNDLVPPGTLEERIFRCSYGDRRE